jgi:HlyD family secretion protein
MSLGILTAIVAAGTYGQWQRRVEAVQTQKQANDFVPTVRVAEARRVADPVALTLPGQTASFDSASVFARATGYIAERHVDIGTRVQKGDLMLRISAPDLDAQLAQAVAQLAQYQASEQQAEAQFQQAQANASLAKVTNRRTSTLAGEGWETKQKR